MKFNMKIDTAIQSLEKNLSYHVVELKEATEEWTKQITTALEKFRDAVSRNGLKAAHDDLHRLMYTRPVDTRAQYSKYLSAMKRAQADGQSHITVDENDHDQIYNDNWDWRTSSKMTNRAYPSKG